MRPAVFDNRTWFTRRYVNDRAHCRAEAGADEGEQYATFGWQRRRRRTRDGRRRVAECVVEHVTAAMCVSGLGSGHVE